MPLSEEIEKAEVWAHEDKNAEVLCLECLRTEGLHVLYAGPLPV